MKGLLVNFLIFIYLVANVGFQINQHFCCGKLVRVELLQGQTPKDCSGKIPGKKRKCCKDVRITIKADNAKEDASSLQLASNCFFLLPAPFYFLFEVNLRPLEQKEWRQWPNGPPHFPGKRPIYLRQRRILV